MKLAVTSKQQFKTSFANNWSEAFAQNKSLIHVDISNNKIGETDVETIAEGLKENHTIFGIHFVGNAGHVDNKGFVIRSDEQTKSDSIFYTRISSSLESASIKGHNRLQL